MIEVDEEMYKQLLKDSNDNRSILQMIKYGLIFIAFLLILCVYGIKVIDISLMKYRASTECQIELIKATNHVRIREIESAGMTTEEYLKWLKIISMEKEE